MGACNKEAWLGYFAHAQLLAAAAARGKMAEGCSNSSSRGGRSLPLKKTVLVCLGERKREVRFEDGDNLLDEVVRIYKDVLPAGVGYKGITLQLKREDWSGEFVDVTPESVPDKCVLKVILPQPITYLKEKVSWD